MSGRTWLVPSLYASGALAAGLLLPRVESRFVPSFSAAVSVPAAMAIYSSIATGMLALTGIVFSLVFLMVQFSATAYSPRLVLWVARSPRLWHALGAFIATFLYAIAALAWVDRGGSDTVPFISSAIVVLLLLASICMFVSLIEGVALLSVNRMLAFTGDRGRAVIDTMYEPLEGDGRASIGDPRVGKATTQTIAYHGRPVAIQSIDVNALVAAARVTGGLIEVVPAIGDTIAESAPLAYVWGARRPMDEREVMWAIVVGEERTFEQDPKYAIRLLVDIAIRALSPAINDPTTAVQALDQIGDLLLRLGRRRLEAGVYRDDASQARLIVPFPTWDDFVLLAFDEIRTYGAGSVQVMRRMRALVADLLTAVPTERRPTLGAWQERLERTILRAYPDREDQLEASTEDRQGLGVPRRRPAA